VVQKLAAEHGLSPEEVARIPGTGLGGRVAKQDVLKYLQTRAAPASAGGERAVAAPTTPPSPPAGPLEESVPLTPVRRRIAENMVRSAREIPAAWSMVEVDVTGLVRRRQGAKEEFLRREGVELTYLPFVVHAVAQALKRHPRLNARWGGDAILVQKLTNIGVAVAAPQGLVVPVVHDADQHSIGGLAKAMAGLVERARQNRLALEDVQGGTFTVNNTGALGSVVSQPIINYPQAAILTTEAIVKRPVVTGDDAIAVRSMMNVCLTFDHRIADGAEAGAFLQEMKRLLEGVGEQTAIY
jgi:2-oxoisovalerate dehydrogenase E2 component (dihydrolipoyl transacylase)